MKKRILISLLLILISFFCFADEEVNFDDFEEDEPVIPEQPAAARNDISFNLYIDLSLTADYLPNASTDPFALTFGQDHVNFLVRAAYKDFISVFMEITNKFSEISIQLVPWWSVIFGNIRVPFGNIDYHPVYGGRVEENPVFLPQVWSNYGLALRGLLFENSASLTLFCLNGFNQSAGNPNFTSMAATDFNYLKTFGLRYRHQFTPAFSLTASALYDAPSSDNSPDDRILMYGLDTVIKIKALTVKLGATVHEIYISAFGAPTQLLFPATYLRYGTYIEGLIDISDTMDMRVRFGHIDPNSSQINRYDMANANAGLIFTFGMLELSAEYNLMMHVYPDPAYEELNFANSLKINALLQL